MSQPIPVQSRSAGTPSHDTVIFDLGAVLIDWNPRHVFRPLIPDEVALNRFLTEVCGTVWNIEQDAGRSFADAIAEAVGRHPDHEVLIRTYHERWEDMLGGPIEGTVAILRQLHACGTRLYALTNWSAETFPIARRKYDFLALFDGIVVSGEEGLVKPDPRIYHRLLSRYRVDPKRAVFIDDSAPNALAASHYFGIHAHLFTDPDKLKADLVGLGFPLT
jgi:2-haloacid dehalogenase